MKNIIVYSTPVCGYCKALKEYLKSNNIEFTEFDLSVDAVKRDEVVNKTGQLAVPVIEIDNEIIVGFDKARIAQALGLNG
jgi:glutaredoxin-like YruB-family protein